MLAGTQSELALEPTIDDILVKVHTGITLYSISLLLFSHILLSMLHCKLCQYMDMDPRLYFLPIITV